MNDGGPPECVECGGSYGNEWNAPGRRVGHCLACSPSSQALKKAAMAQDVAKGARMADNEGEVFRLRTDPNYSGIEMHYDGDDILGVHVDGGGMVYLTLKEVERVFRVMGGFATGLRKKGWG